MKPGYWIAIMALVGAGIGYAFFQRTGWFGTGLGTVLGILAGALIYSRLKAGPHGET